MDCRYFAVVSLWRGAYYIEQKPKNSLCITYGCNMGPCSASGEKDENVKSLPKKKDEDIGLDRQFNGTKPAVL